MSDFIPVNTPLIEGNEIKYVTEALSTGWISSEGPFVKEFESKFANFCDRKFGSSVTNGTDALLLALMAIGIKKGDEVIMPSFTIISCAQTVVQLGGIPVFVDCDADTYNMRADQVEEKISSKTKAIMGVHIYGLTCDMDVLTELGKKHNLFVIEDAAEAHGQTYKGKKCGSLGDISTFSFYANKHITTGEGGMVVTDNQELFDKCQYYKNLCFTRERRFVHTELGHNMRMTNIQAAIGLAQLEQIDKFIEIKKEMGKFYSEKLAGLKNYTLPKERNEFSENHYWVYPLVSKDLKATEIMSKLGKRGIGTRPFFYPLHKQPVFEIYEHLKGQSLPITESIAEMGFYIPSGLSLTTDQRQRVCDILLEELS